MSDNLNKSNSVVADEEVGAPSSASTSQSPKACAPIPRVWVGLVIGVILAGLVLALTVSTDWLMGIVLAIFAYTFGASLALEGSAVREVIVFMASKSISFPGLIWEFSLDGFLWLIGMKLLFAVIGFLFGVLCAVLGVVIAALISPISYPINLISYIKDPT